MLANQTIVGTPLNLSLTTVDAKTGLEVVASVVDSHGTQVARVKLQDIGSGIYVDRSVQMPDVPFVVVQYLITNDDNYEIASERFDSVPKPSAPIKAIEGNIIKRQRANDHIIGEVMP